jgi:hypothetical protein
MTIMDTQQPKVSAPAELILDLITVLLDGVIVKRPIILDGHQWPKGRVCKDEIEMASSKEIEFSLG